MLTEEQEHIELFLKHYYIHEIQRLQQNEFHYISFVLIAQCIELLGTLLDDKPFRAQNQARKRFNLALVKLFPKGYAKKNLKGEIYEHYRCNMSHRFLPSKYITFKKSTSKEEHLSIDNNGIITLSAEQLAVDLEEAVHKIIHRMHNGLLKPKKTGLDFKQLLNFD